MVSNAVWSQHGRGAIPAAGGRNGNLRLGKLRCGGPATTGWQIADSTYFADEDSTSNVASGLTDPGGYTFAAGQFKDASDTTYGINLGASQFTEIEFADQPPALRSVAITAFGCTTPPALRR